MTDEFAINYLGLETSGLSDGSLDGISLPMISGDHYCQYFRLAWRSREEIRTWNLPGKTAELFPSPNLTIFLWLHEGCELKIRMREYQGNPSGLDSLSHLIGFILHGLVSVEARFIFFASAGPMHEIPAPSRRIKRMEQDRDWGNAMFMFEILPMDRFDCQSAPPEENG
jgi:hypothetical protein